MSAPSSPLSPFVVLNSGHTMPRVGLGTWRSPAGQVETAVYEAIKLGYRHIDCARVYCNEAEVGRGLARAIGDGLVKRADLFVTTKIWNTAHATAATAEGLRASLADLQLAYVDLLLIHWSANFKPDKDNGLWPKNAAGLFVHDDPTVATVKTCYQAMESAVDAGLVKSIGVSNFSVAEIDDVLSYARIKPAAHQIEIHPYLANADMIAYCQSKGIVVEAYSPLGNVRNPGQEDVTPLNEPIVAEIAKKHNKSPAQIILRWGLQHSETGAVLPKSTTASRIAENFAIFDFALTPEEMTAMATLAAKNLRFVNPPFNADGGVVFP